MADEKVEEEKKFGFKGLSLGKNTAPKKLQPGVLTEKVEDETETDFIKGVQGNEIESEGGKKTKPEEIVIPLLPNRLFKGLKREKGSESPSETKKRKTEKSDSPKPEKSDSPKPEKSDSPKPEKSDSPKPEKSDSSKTESESEPQKSGDLESNAINELLEDAQRNNEDWENRDLDAPKNMTIAGLENRNLDEESGSESEKEETDYEKVPISSFGMAMLRGMGWKEDEGIGIGDRKKKIDPIQAVARPKGLGLGADRSAHQTKNQVTGKWRSKRDDEELELKTGSFCQISEGKNEDMYGEIVSIDEENTRVHVKLTLGDNIAISQFKIRLVSKTEYTKYSKYINKGKADKFKEEEERKKEEERMNEEKKRDEKEDRRDSKRDRKDDRERYEQRKEEKSKERKRKLWLRSQLRVRIVDKNFKKGKYFKEKVRILDVLDQETCECKTNDGKLLELKQNQLETVIPRDTPFVWIIAGKHAGNLGEILEKDKVKCSAMVQLLSNRDKVLELSYDQVCEFTGDVDAELDY